MNRIPSQAQIRCANKIHNTLGIDLPSEFTSRAYWEYIQKYMDESKSKREAEYTVNGKSGVAEIVLSFNRIPAHCGECRLYIENAWFDEDGMFGDGITHSCPFGCQTFGCLVERPPDCPITPKMRGDT